MRILQFAEQHKGTKPWDQTLIYDLFADIDDNIVVLPGKDQEMYVDKINAALSELDYAVVLVVSDEESQFPYEQLTHPNIKVWVQYPGGIRTADQYLPGGYSPGTRDVKPAPKTLDWFFSGQITHPAREQMAEQLRRLTGGLLIETPGFTQGLSHEDYLDIMARSKIVPCPHGAVTPDTLRLWEALELGCMPVIHSTDRAFYNKILGGFPFPSVDNWSEIKDLEYEDCRGWWNDKKLEMVANLHKDIEELKNG